jgi:hypothetical protein
MLPTETKSPKPWYSRGVQVGLRSLHIVAMALLVGGVASRASPEALKLPGLLTVVSGLLLLAATVRWRCLVLTQGAGWAFFAKLGLIGLAQALPTMRLELLIAATFLTSVAAHMPAAWRHRVLPWRAPPTS